MKKIIFLMFLIMFCTACDIEYNLVIKDVKFNEKLNVYQINYSEFPNELTNNRISLYSQQKSLIDIENLDGLDNYEYYKSKEIKKNSIEYTYDFNIDNYYDSNAANTCYDYFKFNKNGDIVTISTSNSFNCFDYYKELEKVTVNITSYYGVIQSNADKVSGKKHTWEVTPDNAENKPIIFVYDESKKNITLLDYIKENYILFIIIGIFTIGVPIFLLIRIRSKKVNKI